jgi:hypothetical protein
MKPTQNPLLFSEKGPDGIAVDMDSLKASTIFESPTQSRKRLTRRLFRKQTAVEAVKGFSKSVGVFGFTKGQFSLIELIEAVLDITGPAELTVSTWTAANADLSSVSSLLESNKLTGARFIFDFTFQNRQPGLAQNIRKRFGPRSIRVTRNHAKFFQLKAPGWTITCKTSMNLNFNPRFEDFDLSNDPALFAFLEEIVDELFSKKTKQMNMTTNELEKEFQGHGK